MIFGMRVHAADQHELVDLRSGKFGVRQTGIHRLDRPLRQRIG